MTQNLELETRMTKIGNCQNLFMIMKQLVSQVKKRWPSAEAEFSTRIFPRYIETADLKIEEYTKLFHGYISYWRQNLPFFRRSISSLWKKMQISDMNTKWPGLIDEVFNKIARDALSSSIGSDNGLCQILKNLSEEMLTFLGIYFAHMISDKYENTLKLVKIASPENFESPTSRPSIKSPTSKYFLLFTLLK